ncbi:MAG: M23 family metallopeptidase [Thermodesulfobacteriota bacterium]
MKKGYYILLILIIAAAAYSFMTFLETTPPTVEWQNSSNYLQRTAALKIAASDRGTGLKAVKVTYRGADKSYPLFSREFPAEEQLLHEESFDIPINFKKLRIGDGDGVIVLEATDRSKWRFGKGNSTRKEYAVEIDTVPPMVEILTSRHVVSRGGTEMTIYRSSHDTIKTGVKVGDTLFPGQSGAFEEDNIYLSLFSYPHDLPTGEPLFIVAEDSAGNRTKKHLPVHVNSRTYRKRSIAISDSFLERKVPEVLSATEREESGNLLEDFLYINREMRNNQAETIRAVAAESTPEILWEGRFKQLRNSKVEARFADLRSYLYKGRVIDKQYHLGFDLSTTRRNPVTASNSGVIAFAGNLGIYGNAVIIDHGFGLSSLYSHMSSIDVEVMDNVEQGDIIGRTGATGLAGGDHLHFGILVHGIPVTPIEWWDRQWVENRITSRFEAIMFND